MKSTQRVVVTRLQNTNSGGSLSLRYYGYDHSRYPLGPDGYDHPRYPLGPDGYDHPIVMGWS